MGQSEEQDLQASEHTGRQQELNGTNSEAAGMPQDSASPTIRRMPRILDPHVVHEEMK
jgi:hypothetical protein